MVALWAELGVKENHEKMLLVRLKVRLRGDDVLKKIKNELRGIEGNAACAEIFQKRFADAVEDNFQREV